MVIEKGDWEPNEAKLSEARRILLKHYTDIQTAQSTRLIGFVAGLFALLELTLTANNSGISQTFANFPQIPILTDFVLSIPPEIGEVTKAIVFILGTSGILFFIIRTILRYGVYGYMAFRVALISEDEMRQFLLKSDVSKPVTELFVLDVTVTRYVHSKNKAFLVPANLIISVSNLHPKEFPSRTKRGYIYFGLLSFFFSFLLLLLYMVSNKNNNLKSKFSTGSNSVS
jgi:hypothetical protein